MHTQKAMNQQNVANLIDRAETIKGVKKKDTRFYEKQFPETVASQIMGSMKNLKRFLVRYILKQHFSEIHLSQEDKRNMSIVHFYTILQQNKQFGKLLILLETREKFITQILEVLSFSYDQKGSRRNSTINRELNSIQKILIISFLLEMEENTRTYVENPSSFEKLKKERKKGKKKKERIEIEIENVEKDNMDQEFNEKMDENQFSSDEWIYKCFDLEGHLDPKLGLD